MPLFRTSIYGPKNTSLIFVFAGLGRPSLLHWFLGKAFASHGYQAIIYSQDIKALSDNPEETKKHFLEIRQDVLKKIKKLPKKERKQLAVFGTGIGNIPAFMIANEVPGIKKVITNSPMADLSETVWSWNKKKFNFRKLLQKKKITKKQLQQEWFELHPSNNLDTFANKKILLYGAEHDEIIPFQQTKKFIKQLEEDHLDFEAIINSRHKHLISSTINILKFET